MVARVASRGSLNAPWGIAWAPRNFGQFSGDLLVGNFGNGRIHAYRPTAGGWELDGVLRTTTATPIKIDGLWGIAFGNGGAAGPHEHPLLRGRPRPREPRPLRLDHRELVQQV